MALRPHGFPLPQIVTIHCVIVQVHEMYVLPSQTGEHQNEPGTEDEPARRSTAQQDPRDARTLPASHPTLMNDPTRHIIHSFIHSFKSFDFQSNRT